jgi:competence protein ComEC
VLHPPEPEWERQRVRNDDSIVLRLAYGDVEMLLTGDAGVGVEASLPPFDRTRRIRVLKAGHHGSRTSSGAFLLSQYEPLVALISAGRHNVFGHPAPEVMARLAGANVWSWRTDRDGAVSLETDGRELRLHPLAGAAWVTTVRPFRSPPEP